MVKMGIWTRGRSLKTGCEDLEAARERAAYVMEGFKESFGTTEDTMVALLFCAWAYRNLWESYRSSAWTSAGGKAVNLDFLACVALNGTVLCIFSQKAGQ